ncbi:hypothetical protein AVEN_94173-1 [Araneus ventricosus]|uniref:Uncharacterized protein n=1 Tax=Araneus ventricosus TaxID=182803 RepID=A0A4Y2IVU1_ARAVE|nr:hypothetical protein AVEN_94173-1 [Araneus ventricosus]
MVQPATDPHIRRIFCAMGSRTWDTPALKPRFLSLGHRDPTAGDLMLTVGTSTSFQILGFANSSLWVSFKTLCKRHYCSCVNELQYRFNNAFVYRGNGMLQHV